MEPRWSTSTRAPPVVEVQRMKNLSEDEAEQRLSYLAQIVDSRGWAVRGVQGAVAGADSSINTQVLSDAQTAPDMLDESTGVGQALETRLDQADSQRHQAMLQQFQTQSASSFTQTQAPDPYVNIPSPPVGVNNTPEPKLSFNPYPAMHQSVIAPASQATPKPKPQSEPEKPSEKQLSPDIINLANNPDLSVETIAREANRIRQKEELSENEVVISLR
jgi:hypothetical protein